MSDHLDAEQVARLEAVKLLTANRARAAPRDLIATANRLAAFILNGTVPDQDEPA